MLTLRKLRNSLFLLILAILTLSWLPFIKRRKVSQESKNRVEDVFSDVQNTSAKVCILEDGPEALAARIGLINEAKESIDISYYRIDTHSKVSSIFYGALIKAAERGVKVNLIVDAKLGGIDSDFLSVLTNIENITIYFYNPVSWFHPSTLQTTLHNKYLIVDNRWIISGGRNIKDAFYEPIHSKASTSLDLDLLIECELESQIYQDFSSLRHSLMDSTVSSIMHKERNKRTQSIENKFIDAYRRYNEETRMDLASLQLRMYEVSRIRAVHNNCNLGLKEPIVAYALYYLAKHNRESIRIQSPYVTADKRILGILKDINTKSSLNLYTNSLKTSPNYPAFSNYWTQRDKFMNTGITVYEYQNDANISVHTKAYLFYSWAAIGSFNLDNRSININTETMIFSDDIQFHEDIRKIMDRIENQSVNLKSYGDTYHRDYDKPVSFKKRFVMRLSGIFSRLFKSLI